MDNGGVPLAGLCVGGYRSFHFGRQFIAPLSRVTVIAGQNNSGKSNALAAARDWLPWLADPQPGTLPSGQDRPILADPSQKVPFEIGIALAPSDGDPAASLRRALEESLAGSRTDAFGLAHQIAHAEALHHPSTGDLIWFRYAERAGELVYCSQQLEDLAREIGQHGLLPLISGISNGGADPATHLVTVLERWRSSIEVPGVVFVPPVRSITGNETSASDQIATGHLKASGEGLPAILQALQAPSAEHYREHTAKFQRINEFVRLVLEDDTAHVMVPYDRSTVHVGFGDASARRDKVLPLERLGQGISQVVLLAAIATWYDNQLVCIEEPETNLHPVHLRRLVAYLKEKTSNQYILSSHSSHLLDSSETTILKLGHSLDHGTTVELVLSQSERAELSRHLGYRPSDLLQANSVLWVEGPSDRVYLNWWIMGIEPRFREGIHYSILCYGGSVRTHLTPDDVDEKEAEWGGLISLPRINRSMAILIDSDKRSASAAVAADKLRVDSGFRAKDCISWITAGREIENYIAPEVFSAAVMTLHPTVTSVPISGSPFADYFKFAKKGGQLKSTSKVRIAELVVEQSSPRFDILDLKERVQEVVEFIRKANDISG